MPWVEAVAVRLEDQACADELNDTVNAGRSFSRAFS